MASCLILDSSLNAWLGIEPHRYSLLPSPSRDYNDHKYNSVLSPGLQGYRALISTVQLPISSAFHSNRGKFVKTLPKLMFYRITQRAPHHKSWCIRRCIDIFHRYTGMSGKSLYRSWYCPPDNTEKDLHGLVQITRNYTLTNLAHSRSGCDWRGGCRRNRGRCGGGWFGAFDFFYSATAVDTYRVAVDRCNAEYYIVVHR